MKNTTILLLPEKADAEFDQVCSAWINKGGVVKRLGKYWIKDEELAGQKIAIYGNQAFALVLAQLYDVQLLSPDDAFIVKLAHRWIKRDIRVKQVGQITERDFPVFIKPVIPKIFLAGIFQTINHFKEVVNGLPAHEEIMASGIIPGIQAEARSYILNGVIRDLALYEGDGDLVSGKEFLTTFINDHRHDLPSAVVIDIAYAVQTGWFILEFNACWGAGLNNCTAGKVIDCIIAATVNE